MKRILLLSALSLSATFGAQAEMISLDSNLGADTITYDTNTGLGWLDLNLTEKTSYNAVIDRLENDADYSDFRLASYGELDVMINDVFPSLFTATNFYFTNLLSPIVDTSEGDYFRTLFGNGYQIIMGKTSDGETLRWAGSNDWDDGRVAYTDIYEYTSGQPIDNEEIYGDSSQKAGWFLVSSGTADLTSGTFIASDVPAPFMAFAGLGLLALGMRRKKH